MQLSWGRIHCSCESGLGKKPLEVCGVECAWLSGAVGDPLVGLEVGAALPRMALHP